MQLNALLLRQQKSSSIFKWIFTNSDEMANDNWISRSLNLLLNVLGLESRESTEINQNTRRLKILPFQWVMQRIKRKNSLFQDQKWNEKTDENSEESMRGIESEMESNKWKGKKLI